MQRFIFVFDVIEVMQKISEACITDILARLPSVYNPSNDSNNISVWEQISSNRDSYKMVREEFTYRGKPHVAHRLYILKYIGKPAFKKLVKCPMIGGVRGSSYLKGINAFDIYDQPVINKLEEILN